MLIKDLIHIQERVNKDDFVLKLTAGVADPGSTLGTYVVTKELVQNFDDALGFIKGAIDSNKSRGSYLHGRFGSGKSHFMAVLHLILQHIPAVRSIPELAKVFARHTWVEDKKVTRVTFEIEPMGEICKLRLTHHSYADANAGVENGWPGIVAGLKTLLETGRPLNVPGM